MTSDAALSVAAAAREAPGAPAVITSTRTWTYAELAAIATPPGGDEAVVTIVATPEVATVAAILGAFDAGRPVALLHPRAGDEAHAAARARLAAADVPAGTLVVVFTSGSTGAPRGVILSRAAARAAIAASAAHLGDGDDDRWLCCLPLAHAGGLNVVLRALAARRPLVLHDGPFDAAAALALARAARVTHASVVPTQLAAIVDALDRGAAPPPWRAVLVGGAAASPPLLARAAAAGVPVLRTYGLTETFGQVATQRPADAGHPDAPVVPLPGVTITAGAPGAPAPIAITTPAVMTGYLGDPPPPPHAPGAPLVTSDLGWLDAGGLHVAGRADDVIITGGENVHPAEVEALLAGAPGVAAACAFGVPDPRWGQIVAAAVVPVTAGFDVTSLHAYLAARLPSHLRPRRLAVVDALPLGPTGKVDRRALAKDLSAAW